jgi:arsenate reductase-like glutaredoxin family protein
MLTTGLVVIGVATAAGLVAADPAAPLFKPAEAISAALADVKTVDQPQQTRYLWLGNPSNQADRASLISCVNFGINSLSKRKLLHSVDDLGGCGLVRLQLSHYGIDTTPWDELGAKGSGPVRSSGQRCPEPYFHLLKRTILQEFTEKLIDVPRFQEGGKWYNQRWVKEPGKSTTKEELLHGPWLPADAVRELCLLTQCDFPILRADWFVANALIAPAYQQLLGAKDLAAFDDHVRFRSRDEDLAVKGAVLFSSEVAIHNRALLRSPTVFGYYWRSFDYLASTADKDVMANVLSHKADAHEIIASAPNGLQHYLIVNSQNKIIDSGDPNIVIDRSTTWDNKLVWTGISCMICHAKGLKSFKDDVRALADANKRIFALVRQEHLERFTDLFGPQIGKFVAADQDQYAQAIKQITGLTPEKNAESLAKQFLDYVQRPVTLEQVSLETGYSRATILAALKKHQGLDPLLTQLIAGSSVRRDQFERSFGQLMVIMEGERQ